MSFRLASNPLRGYPLNSGRLLRTSNGIKQPGKNPRSKPFQGAIFSNDQASAILKPPPPRIILKEKYHSSTRTKKEWPITTELNKALSFLGQLKEIPETKNPLIEKLDLNKNETMKLLITYFCIAEGTQKHNNQRMMIPLQKIQSIILFLALNLIARKGGQFRIFTYYRQTFLHPNMLDKVNPINVDRFIELAINSMFPMNNLYENSALSKEIQEKHFPVGTALGKGEANTIAQIYMRQLLNDMNVNVSLFPRVNILVGGDTFTRGCDSSGIVRTLYDMSQLKEFDTNIIIFILNGVSITLPLDVEKTKAAILEDFGRYAEVIGEWDASDSLGIANALYHHANPTEGEFGKNKIMFVITNKDTGKANRLAQGHASEPGRSDEDKDLYQFILNILLPFHSGDIDLQEFITDIRKKVDGHIKKKIKEPEKRTREDILKLSELNHTDGEIIEGDHNILSGLGQKVPGKDAYTEAIRNLEKKGKILWLGQEKGGVYGDNSNLGSNMVRMNFVPDEQRITENAVAAQKVVGGLLDQDGKPYIVICRGPHWPFQLLAMPTAYEGAKSKFVTGQTGNIIILVDSGTLVDENDENFYAKVGEKHNLVRFPEEPMVIHVAVSSMGELPSVMNTVYDMYRQDFTVVVHLPTKDFTRGVILDSKDDFGYNDVKRFSFDGIENKQSEKVFVTYGPITKLVGREIKALNQKCTLYQLMSPSHMPDALKKEITEKLATKPVELFIIDPDPVGKLTRSLTNLRQTFSASERERLSIETISGNLGIIPQGFDPIQTTRKDIRDFLIEIAYKEYAVDSQKPKVFKSEGANQERNTTKRLQIISFTETTDFKNITPDLLEEIEFQLCVAKGAEVKTGDPIATYIADKATVDIVAPTDGKVVKIFDINASSDKIAVLETSSDQASSKNNVLTEIKGLYYKLSTNTPCSESELRK